MVRAPRSLSARRLRVRVDSANSRSGRDRGVEDDDGAADESGIDSAPACGDSFATAWYVA
jgi:hypothetical protein